MVCGQSATVAYCICPSSCASRVPTSEMAELQLAVRYRPNRMKPLFGFIDAMRWFWLIILPSLGLSFLTFHLILGKLALGYDPVLINAVGVVVVWAICVGAGGLLLLPVRDFYVKLSKDGIVLPWLVSLRYGTRTNLIWQEVKDSTIVGTIGQEKLVLGLDDGKRVGLDLGGFSKDELEQLLLGAELWGTSTKRSTELIDYQTNLQNQMRGIERQSYTQMWEDELNRRFRSTSFLPLDPEHKLQNGRLKIVRQLAFGGLAAIYLVQKDEQDIYVLKEAVVPSNADADIRREAEKHLARESQLLFALDHPNIARVLDYFVEEGRTYLLMEYINGQDLRQFVRQNGPQPIEKVVGWAKEMAVALKYLHERTPPVIHRDFTPDNVVLSNQGSLVIIDFGAANEFIGTATGTLIGKQAYISPEQLRGKATCQSDLYALGAMLFFLLTARDPFPLTSSSPRDVLPGLPEDIDKLILDLTALEATDRIINADELLQRLALIDLEYS